MAKSEFEEGTKLGEVSIGNEVQYGWLKGKLGAQRLVGIVGYPLREKNQIEVVVTRDNRLGKVLLPYDWTVIDLGRPRERFESTKSPVPGI